MEIFDYIIEKLPHPCDIPEWLWALVSIVVSVVASIITVLLVNYYG